MTIRNYPDAPPGWWSLSQKGQKHFQKSHQNSRMQKNWMDSRVQRWKDIVEYSDRFVYRRKNHVVIDIGCGPAGVFLALDNHKVYCVDPLADYYVSEFPYLQNQNRLIWISEPFEEASIDSKVNVSYSMNAIDHVYSLRAFMSRLVEILVPEGHFVVTVNCFRNIQYRRMFDTLGSLIDPDHPYHFTKEEFESMLKGSFEVLNVVQTEDVVSVREKRSHVPVKTRILHALKNPGHALRFLAWKFSEFESYIRGRGKRSFYIQYLFIARKKDAANEQDS